MKSNADQLTDLTDLLLENLKNRKGALLNHPAMLCAIFLDPRIHRQLELEGETEYKIAKMTLANLSERIFNLKEKTVENPDENVNESIEEYFQQANFLNNGDQFQRAEFMESLDHFHRSLPYLKLNKGQTISDFWESKKETFPALYEVACVINAIPPSQATVERSFSTLKFMFGVHRTRLDQGKLENLLMIKLNADMANEINQTDLEKIKKKYSSDNA